ncbi:MAG: AhpC/TSA family protein [Phycisphaerales bacterium]|nr:AhpC/TSA family protein [Phycisphaerales bacterium]
MSIESTRSMIAALASAGVLVLSLASLGGCDGAGTGSETAVSNSASSSASMPAADDPAKAVPAARPLQAQLEAKKADFIAKAPPERVALYEQGVRDVAESGVLTSAKKVGDRAPDFSLPDAKGDTVVLADLLAKGPVVITWYRGGWCPYCNLQLKAMQDRLPDFERLGATVVAISPEKPDESLSTAEKDALAFLVLSDHGNAVADRYGVRYKLPGAILEQFNKGFGLDKHNDDDSGTLPLAATYVLDRDGVIRWAFVSADYRERAEPGDVVAAIEAVVR